MDAVILAGGRGTRMEGVAEPFHKPLLPVNGVPLVCAAVDLAHGAGVDRPVVVVAPENASAIATALGVRKATLIIQREPLGPADALLTGLRVRTKFNTLPDFRVLVLLSDNVTTDHDVALVTAHETAVGIRAIDPKHAHRFTRLEEPGMWVEKKPITDMTKPVPCWVGPFVGWRDNMERALADECTDAYLENREALIGPLLNKFSRDGRHTVVNVSSYDVGTIEAYREEVKQ